MAAPRKRLFKNRLIGNDTRGLIWEFFVLSPNGKDHIETVKATSEEAKELFPDDEFRTMSGQEYFQKQYSNEWKGE